MKEFFTRRFLLPVCIALLCSNACSSQNSILVNFGSATCQDTFHTVFSLIQQPLSSSPNTLIACDLSQQTPTHFAVFIAYNPKDNKLYINDTRYRSSRVWVLDVGLPNDIACPPSIPLTPTYTYSYVPNNFEFDNNGNLWSFHSFNTTTGLCTMDNFDVTNGNVLSTKTLQFPPGNLPLGSGSLSALDFGDVAILPNGRMFVVFGENPSKLYEVTNYNGGVGNAVAKYLQSMPQDPSTFEYYNTFGLAYINGSLEITGTDGTICYYFPYNISSDSLGAGRYFQNTENPIDNTSIDPIVGVTKKLISATKVNSNTADLTYNVFVKNMGNAILQNINVSDNLGTTFGAANVSNVTTSFVPEFNNAGLTLSNTYNGTTDTFLLNSGQDIANQISIDSNYFFEIQIKCRVTNLVLDSTYLNSAIGTGSIDNGANLYTVLDSSNNGDPSVIDPNNDNNPSEPGENIPTPFTFNNLLPVHFINVGATLINKVTAEIQWTIATPAIDAASFEIEYSTDGTQWSTLASLNISNVNQADYSYEQKNIPSGNIFYRIKETDISGLITYSKTVALQNSNGDNGYIIYPNPANENINISSTTDNINKNTAVELLDELGRVIDKKAILTQLTTISTKYLSRGTYWLRIQSDNTISNHKIIVTH